MKTKFLLSLFSLFTISAAAKTWTVASNGFEFSPATLTIQKGDTVVFSLVSIHDAVEVNQSTWNANGSTALSGGFRTPFGGGTVLPAQLGQGTHYYVCSAHASMGMKGTIIVQGGSGISDPLADVQVGIYPNPSKGKFKVDVPAISAAQTGTFELFSLTGELVLRAELKQVSTQITIEDPAKGIYLARIRSGSGELVRKVMIE